MDRECYITVDVGSTNIKAAKILEDGTILHSSSIRLSPRGDKGMAQVDAEELYSTVIRAVREAAGCGSDSVKAIGIVSQMAGMVLLDSHKNPVFPVIYGIDTRGQDFLEEWTKRIDKEEILKVTRCPLEGIYWPAKWLWLQANESEKIQNVRYVLGIKDYLIYRMTGELVTDPSLASATSMYDLEKGNWWEKCREILEMDGICFPKIRKPSEIAGEITRGAALELGLSPGIPVIVGSGDGPASSISCGALRPENGCISFGTTTVIRFLGRGLPEHLTEKCFCQHFYDDWYFYGLRLNDTGKTVDMYKDMEDAPGGESKYFWINGTFFPTEPITSYEKYQAVLLGILFQLYDGFEDLSGVVNIQKLCCTGGGSRDRMWMQQLANLFGKPVILQEEEGSFTGILAMILAALNKYDDIGESIRHIHPKKEMLFPSDGQQIREQYDIYKNLLRT